MVLKSTGAVVKWYIALFILFFFIFAHVLYLMIGPVSESFSNFWSSYYSTLVTVIGMYVCHRPKNNKLVIVVYVKSHFSLL